MRLIRVKPQEHMTSKPLKYKIAELLKFFYIKEK